MTIKFEDAKKYMLALYIIIFTTTISETLNRVFLVLTVCLCGYSYFKTSATRFKMNYLVKNLFYLGAMLLVSILYTIAPFEKVKVLIIGYFSMLFVVFFISDAIKNEEDVLFFLKVFIFASVVNCVTTYFLVGSETFSLLGSSDTSFRLASDEQNANDVGMTCAYGTIFSLWFLNYGKAKGDAKIWFVFAFLINFIFGLLTGSRKAMLMLVIGISIVLFMKSVYDRNAVKNFFKMLGVIVVICFVVSMIRNNDLFSVVNERVDGLIAGFSGRKGVDQSTSDRMLMSEVGMKLFWGHPFFGRGAYASYVYFRTYSHNNFVELLMNMGFVGFALFYWPFAKNIKRLIRIDRREPLLVVAIFVILWLLIGGCGYVFYFSKVDMSILAVITSWIVMKEKYDDKKSFESY